MDNEAEATIELSAQFLAFIAKKLSNEIECKEAYISVLLSAFKFFTSSYLTTKDVHSLSADFDIETRKTVLSAYFHALATLQADDSVDAPEVQQPALISDAKAGKASIYAIFGGQGTNEVYFDELQNLYDIYTPYVASFLSAVTKDVLIPLAASQEHASYYSYGLDVFSWLSGKIPRPDGAYLASIPISFPLIGLTQLVQYLVACKVAGLTPGEYREHLAGATGHSQGIVSAVAIAASTSFESYTENGKKALKWLFFSGLRGQEAFPVVALEPSIVQDSIEGGEGAPSPMLSVVGLALTDLEPHVNKTNKHLPESSKVHISLHNGPRAFVVTGPSRSLYGLVTNLRKVRAGKGVDQSKIAFSQRKPVFSTRFLVINVPYHSSYLESCTEKVMEDLGNEELWTPADLQLPVYHTEDGMSSVFSA